MKSARTKSRRPAARAYASARLQRQPSARAARVTPPRATKSSSSEDPHFWARFVALAPCPCLLLDDSAHIREANASFWKLAAVKDSAPAHTFLSAYIHRDSVLPFLRCLRDAREPGRPAEAHLFLRHPGSSTVPVRLVIQSTDDPENRYVVLLLDDTVRHREMQARAREKQTHFDFIDSVDGIVWEMDLDSGRTTYLSKEAERLLGFPASEWDFGIRFRERHLFIEDRDRVLDQFVRAAKSRENFAIEYRMIAADRHLVWLRDAVIVREIDGRLKLRGVAMDVTERKNTEKLAALASEDLEKRVKERTAELQWTVSELQSFSYTLSHDMRAPLRSIQGYAQLIAESQSAAANPETNDFLHRIMKSARRLDALVQDVLKYGSLAKGHLDLSKVDVDALVRSIVDESPELNPPRVTVEICNRLAPVFAHEGFLCQCLSNLFSNALKFVAPGVKPHLRVWTERRDENFVLLWVEDNGIGIAPEDHLRVFKVFERCHGSDEYEGTGIGLAIVERAAQRMNGSVGVESSRGQGSKFWIQLMAA